jgi:DNA polymerase-3 subunit delta'
MQFKDVHAYSDLKHKLVQNFKQNRIPHAQLFIGPEGCGNLSLALALTQLIYCQNPTENDSCGICSSCIKVSKLTHPDVHFTIPTIGSKEISTSFLTEWRELVESTKHFNAVDWTSKIAKDENKALNITKEETRDIKSKLSLKPFEGEAKTLIIWMPEYLSKEGNSLLKLIEEPSQKTYFILVANNFDSLLTTITSRTQLVKVPAYTEEEIIQLLGDKYHLDHQKAESIAFLAEGNMNTAIAMVESVENNYAEMFRNWMLSCYKNNLQEVSSIMDELSKLGRTQIQLFLRNGLKILRESLLYLNIEDYEIKFEGEYKDFIKKFSNTLNAKHIESSYQQINDTIYHIQRNANAKISLFNLSLALRHNFIRKR